MPIYQFQFSSYNGDGCLYLFKVTPGRGLNQPSWLVVRASHELKRHILHFHCEEDMNETPQQSVCKI